MEFSGSDIPANKNSHPLAAAAAKESGRCSISLLSAMTAGAITVEEIFQLLYGFDGQIIYNCLFSLEQKKLVYKRLLTSMPLVYTYELTLAGEETLGTLQYLLL
jgi:DNA-binding HxlR family transcriptional regulator